MLCLKPQDPNKVGDLVLAAATVGDKQSHHNNFPSSDLLE
jgi:hypothetical protein